MNKSVVIKFLTNKLITYSTGWNTVNVALCQPKEAGGEHIHLNPSTGDFYCSKCNKMSEWSEFKNLVETNRMTGPCPVEFKKLNLKEIGASVKTADLNSIKNYAGWANSKKVRSLSDLEFRIFLKNCGFHTEFNKNLFETYDIRFDTDFRALFPVYDQNKCVIDVIAINSSDEPEQLNKHHVYGLEHIAENTKSKEIYITDKIIDMLTLNQELKVNCIVLSSPDVIDFRMVSMLERFEKVIIWQKEVKIGYSIAQVLNFNRCYLISHARSPFECFSMNESISRITKTDKFPIKSESIVQFDSLKSKVYSEITCIQKYTGIQWTRFHPLNNILKGHRAGEVTVFTGPTGSGKTTFLSQYSVDLCVKNVKTLWGSFELQNHRLVKMMITQYAGFNLAKNVKLFEFVANKFANLPMYFMSFHGQESLENVIKTMANAVVTHDIKHIIIDNLQFMIGTMFGPVDKFSQQDQIIGAFRRFATNFNVHITIVIHPRKEDSNEPLKISSIFGSAKATQEADNVMILQQLKVAESGGKTSHVKYVQIVKNRFDGELGNIGLKFDKETLSFEPIGVKEKNASRLITEDTTSADSSIGSLANNLTLTN